MHVCLRCATATSEFVLASLCVLQNLLSNCVANVIASIVFGKRYEHADPAFVQLVKDINIITVALRPESALHTFPFLRHLPAMKRSVRQLEEAVRSVASEIQRNVAKHERLHQVASQSAPADFIDAYLQKAEQQTYRGYTDSTFTELQLLRTVADLFWAGYDTVTATLRWGLLFMLKNPDVMRRVHAEIDDVIGRGRLPCMADQDDMPYTEATIAEIQRVADIVPLVPHEVLQDILLG
ncbi:PREDICTED: cytochrome P450 2H1-like, partial [Priapulus caudatus]|uniref:Cytochrome P450 2H1-like n=1 Tax=Priapulus caudatus TaxID=37621 RepID=A0ABM1F6D8_PRICU